MVVDAYLTILRKINCRKTVVGPPVAASKIADCLALRAVLYKDRRKVHGDSPYKYHCSFTCLTALH
jgi:hypothetical protein